MLWTPRPGDEAVRVTELEQVAHVLQSLRDQLRQEAIASGWEIEEPPVNGPPERTS